MRPKPTLRRAMMASLVILLTCGFTPLRALAHSMNQSAVLLDFHGDTVDAELQLPLERLSLAWGRSVSAQTISEEETALGQYILNRIHAQTSDGRFFHVRQISALSIITVEGSPYLSAHLELEPPQGAKASVFELTDVVILDRLASSVALISIRSDWNSSTFADDPQFVGILRKSSPSVTIDRTGGSWFRGFKSIFSLGLRHIAEGTDHLLFLLALLLPAPLLASYHRWSGPVTVSIGFVRIMRIVTAFTLGHSLTLAIAASGLVHVPGRPIEVLIAVSILVSAIHALRPIFPGREAVVAASFGLIHGLAFASTLAGLGLGRWERVASILAFNLGIETMQLIVVLATMPSLMLLSRTRLYPPIRVCGALFAGVASLGWIAQRMFGTHDPMDSMVDQLAAHAPWVAICLFGLAVVASPFTQLRSRTPSEHPACSKRRLLSTRVL